MLLPEREETHVLHEETSTGNGSSFTGKCPPPCQLLASDGSRTWQTQSGRGCLPSAEAHVSYLDPPHP